MSNFKKVKGDSYYGKMAALYQKKRQRGSFWNKEQETMQAFLNELPDGLKVLDMPFGTGRFTKYFLEHGYEVYGLDASEEMLAQSKIEMGDEVYEQCNLQTGFSTELPFEDNSFDLFVSVRFLRDIIRFGDVKKSLAEMQRVTKSYAIIELGEEIKPTEDYPKDNERIASRMSSREVADLFGEYGFEIKQKVVVREIPEENGNVVMLLCQRKL